MNWTYLFNAVPKFAEAAKLTLELSLYGIALSLLFGLAVAVVTAYKIRPLYAPARAYIELSRNTPLLTNFSSVYYRPAQGGHQMGRLHLRRDRARLPRCELHGRGPARGHPRRAAGAD